MSPHFEAPSTTPVADASPTVSPPSPAQIRSCSSRPPGRTREKGRGATSPGSRTSDRARTWNSSPAASTTGRATECAGSSHRPPASAAAGPGRASGVPRWATAASSGSLRQRPGPGPPSAARSLTECATEHRSICEARCSRGDAVGRTSGKTPTGANVPHNGRQWHVAGKLAPVAAQGFCPEAVRRTRRQHGQRVAGSRTSWEPLRPPRRRPPAAVAATPLACGRSTSPGPGIPTAGGQVAQDESVAEGCQPGHLQAAALREGTIAEDDRLVQRPHRSGDRGPGDHTAQVAGRVPEAAARRAEEDLVALFQGPRRIGPPGRKRHALLGRHPAQSEGGTRGVVERGR